MKQSTHTPLPNYFIPAQKDLFPPERLERMGFERIGKAPGIIPVVGDWAITHLHKLVRFTQQIASEGSKKTLTYMVQWVDEKGSPEYKGKIAPANVRDDISGYEIWRRSQKNK